MLPTHFFRQFDWLLALAVFALVAFGLSAIYSVALSQPVSELLPLKKQLVALAIGLGLALFLLLANYRFLDALAPHLFIAGILLLVLVLMFGETIRGTTGWFQLFGFSFQPVEFMKIAFIAILARFFSRRTHPFLLSREILTSGIFLLPSVVLLLLQPDLGSALVLVGVWLCFLLFARLSWRQWSALFFVGLLAMLIGWGLLADYQKARLTSFWHPEKDALGEGYNVTQSVIAVGSGGFVGRGLGFGSQSQLRFLPEAHTDFVFAVIAEELGFVGVSLLLFAFAMLLWRLGRLARRVPDDFTMYLVLGFGSLIFLQFTVNVGMNVGLLPVTGITLPFVSYGGSSLIAFLAIAGILESVVLRLSVFGERDPLFL